MKNKIRFENWMRNVIHNVHRNDFNAMDRAMLKIEE